MAFSRGLALVALFVLPHASILLATQQDSSVEPEIARLEKEYNDAYAANDLPKYFSYLAPDFIQFVGSGREELAKYKKDWEAFIAGGGRVQAATIEDLIVKVGPSGDSAIASYILHVKTRSSQGQERDRRYQESDVWFKRAGAWKIVHLHYSAARQPAQQ